jgi:hypothetical protein
METEVNIDDVLLGGLLSVALYMGIRNTTITDIESEKLEKVMRHFQFLTGKEINFDKINNELIYNPKMKYLIELIEKKQE